MKAVIVYRSGLGTDPNGDLCGARARLELLCQTIHADLVVIAWDDPDAAAKMQAVRNQWDFLVLIGHSHGASAALTYALFAPAQSIDALGVIDDCPPGNPLGHLVEELDPPASAKAGCAFWQRNSEPSGVAFKKTTTFESYNVSDWINANGRKLGHIDFPVLNLDSIAGDGAVWDIIESIVFSACYAASPRPKVLAPLPDSLGDV